MKFDLFSWETVPKPGLWNEGPKGRLRLQLSEPAALFVRAVDDQGQVIEVCAGYSAAFDLTLDIEYEFSVGDGPEVYIHRREWGERESSGAVFTSVAKMPGHMSEIDVLVRRMQAEHRSALASMRQEAAALRAEREGRLAVQVAAEKSSTAEEKPDETEA